MNTPIRTLNTVIEPGTDVVGDIASIDRGGATWDSATNRYRVNGRTYGIEPDGTLFPVSGPGFTTLDRSEFKALQGVIEPGGDPGRRPASLTRTARRSALRS